MHNFEDKIRIDKNITLKKSAIEDVKDFYDILQDSDVTEHLPVETFKDIKEAEDYFRKILNNIEKNGGFIWKIENSRSMVTIGFIKLTDWHNEKRAYSIEFFLKKTYWSIGIATNVLNILINSLENKNIGRLEAKVRKANVGSIRVLEKNGFDFDHELQDQETLIFKYVFK